MKFSATTHDATEQLKNETDQRFTSLLKHGTMEVEYYAPDKVDHQTPHKQDELYVIASGQSSFYRDGETIQCKTGDVIFVPAGMEHRFLNFSNDFATWVIFYGTCGGEKSTGQ